MPYGIGYKLLLCKIYSQHPVSSTAPLRQKYFKGWIEHGLLPELKEKSVLIMDHATFRKGKSLGLKILISYLKIIVWSYLEFKL